jgi:glycosyltransferase involved in cell wall biosynthesis
MIIAWYSNLEMGSATTPGVTPCIGFIFSTEVGLKTQYQNWRAALTRLAPALSPDWIVIDWYKPDGLLERLPLLPPGIKARIRSQLQLEEGLKRGPFDGLLIGAPAVAYHQRRLLQRQPYFVSIDCTPRQLQAMGELYDKHPSSLASYESWKEQARLDFYQRARLLFPWSNWAAQSMIADYGADPTRVEVVPPGVDLRLWEAPRRPEPETVHLLFVGGDFARKGGDLLLKWALQTRRRNWQLHLVTRDPVATSHPCVHIYSHLGPNHPELIALYQRASLFVIPTRGDCYSLAAMEALASGLPVLLGNVGGTADIIHEGETGYLLPPGDYDSLVDRLEFLLAAPERLAPMGEAARRDAEARYDIEKNVGRILTRIEQVLATES